MAAYLQVAGQRQVLALVMVLILPDLVPDRVLVEQVAPWQSTLSFVLLDFHSYLNQSVFNLITRIQSDEI